MKHIPNLLSFFRIILIPFFVLEMLKGNTAVAGGILLVSSVSDFLDGLLARKFSWVSKLGKILDPLADKLTQVTVSLLLLLRLIEYWYFFAFMIFKDFIILLLGGILLRQGMQYEGSKFLGKASTFFFYAGMISIIFFPTLPEWLIFSILVVSFSLALISGVLYIPQFFIYKNEIADGKQTLK